MYARRLALVALLATACTPRVQTDPVTGRVDVDVQPVTQSGQVWTATLQGRSGFTGLSGTARAEVLSGQTTVNVQLQGATPGRLHPWHVHEGTCGSGGAIVGASSAYTPLQVASNGEAQGTARLNLALNEARDYHINVHASPGELGTIIACGNLDD